MEVQTLVDPSKLKETLRKIHHKIDNLAEAKGMTRDEFDEWGESESYRLELDDGEFNLILAYQIEQCAKKLEAKGLSVKADNLRRERYWIERFKHLFHTPEISKAFTHLTKVCSYHDEKYNHKHPDAWLVDWDERLFELMKVKRNGLVYEGED